MIPENTDSDSEKLKKVDPSMINVIVRDRIDEAEGVISLLLERPDGGSLPKWEPGAHLELVLGESLIRQYSLSSDPQNSSQWRLGVLREPEGRGGSERVFQTLLPGVEVVVSEPRNNFLLEPSSQYLFIAGGIGITPILSMITVAERKGIPWRLLYGGRSRNSMAFVKELQQYGDRVTFAPQDEVGLLDLASWLEHVEPGMTVYSCGPEPLLNAVERQMAHWPAGSLRVERFRPKVLESVEEDHEFEVEFIDSDVTLKIPADRSILSVAEDAGLPVFSSCGEGTCGTCQTRVIEGLIDHRDSLLSKEEQGRNDIMLICVSRAAKGCSKLRLRG